MYLKEIWDNLSNDYSNKDGAEQVFVENLTDWQEGLNRIYKVRVDAVVYHLDLDEPEKGWVTSLVGYDVFEDVWKVIDYGKIKLS